MAKAPIVESNDDYRWLTRSSAQHAIALKARKKNARSSSITHLQHKEFEPL
jgi:hypothetical protein